MFNLINLCAFIAASVAPIAEYKAKPIDTVAHFDGKTSLGTFIQWSALNNNGYVCSVIQSADHFMLYTSSGNSDLIIFGLGPPLGSKILFNDNHQIVCRSPDTSHTAIFDPKQGWKKLWWNMHCQASDLNDNGQLIGRAEDKAFLWDNGLFTDMSPKSVFGRSFESLGYLIADIHLEKINNSGEMVGYFSYGKLNTQNNTVVPLGEKPFFWDGIAHIINCPWSPKGNDRGCELIAFNNCGYVLIVDFDHSKSYLWHLKTGITELPNIRAMSINDSNTILGYSPFLSGKPMIGKNCCNQTVASLLGYTDLKNLAPAYSSTYAIEEIQHLVKINNKGQILALGKIWGEWHPCILEPIN